MFDTSSQSNPRIDIIQTIGIEANRIIEINAIQAIDQEIFHTTGQIMSETITTSIKIYHETTHKVGIQTITIDNETVPNLLIGITTVIPTFKTSIEATHQNIKDKIIKFNLLKEQLQTPLY